MTTLPSIHHATHAYERWLGECVALDDTLAAKHAAMREAPFPFLRATFYRWHTRWPEVVGAVAPALGDAREVLAVGDLHVEKFGTWRDAEGRLVWGINDFDEAWPLPWPYDLVRLATSARLAAESGGLALEPEDAADALLAGYAAGLHAEGRPFVLAEGHPHLHAMATERLHDPAPYWEKLSALPEARDVAPRAIRALERVLPRPALAYRLLRRQAGLGSLGRSRVVALAEWRGGAIAREAKAAAPSACAWALGRPPRGDDARTRDVLDAAVRCADPFLVARRRWIARRLAPDCSRIELAALPHRRDERRLLHAMGFETANVHLGSAPAKALASDVQRVREAAGRHWLAVAAARGARHAHEDWEGWRRAD